jgi:chorismate synthase
MSTYKKSNKKVNKEVTPIKKANLKVNKQKKVVEHDEHNQIQLLKATVEREVENQLNSVKLKIDSVSLAIAIITKNRFSFKSAKGRTTDILKCSKALHAYFTKR